MEDIWRKLNPKLTILLFILIDIILFQESITNDIGLITRKVEIMPEINSDHNPLLWRGMMGLKKFKWRLNEDFLNQQPVVDFVQKETNLSPPPKKKNGI